MKSIFKTFSFRSKKNDSSLKPYDSDRSPGHFMDNPMAGNGSESDSDRSDSTSSTSSTSSQRRAAEELRIRISPESDTLFSEYPSLVIGKLVKNAPDDSSVGRARTISRTWSEENEKQSQNNGGKKGKVKKKTQKGDEQKTQKVDLKKLLPSQSWSESTGRSGLLGKFRRNKSLPLESNENEEIIQGDDITTKNVDENMKTKVETKKDVRRRSDGSNNLGAAISDLNNVIANTKSKERDKSMSVDDDDDDDDDDILDPDGITTYETYDPNNDNDDMDVGDPNDGCNTTDWEEYDDDDDQKDNEEEFQAARSRGRTRSVYSSADSTGSDDGDRNSDSDRNSDGSSGGLRDSSDGGRGRQGSASGRVGYDTGYGVVSAHRHRVDMMKSMGYGHKPERLPNDKLNPGEKQALEDGLKQASIRSNFMKIKGSVENNNNNHFTKFIHEYILHDRNENEQEFSSIERPESNQLPSSTSQPTTLVSRSPCTSLKTYQSLTSESTSIRQSPSNINYTPIHKYYGVGGKVDNHSDDDDSEEDDNDDENGNRSSRTSSIGNWTSSSHRGRSMSGGSSSHGTSSHNGGGGIGSSSHGGFSSRQRRSSKFLPINVAKMQRARVVLVGNKSVGISTIVQGIYQINHFRDVAPLNVQGYNSKPTSTISQFGMNSTYKFNISPHHHIDQNMSSNTSNYPSILGLFHSTHPVTLYGATSTLPYKVQIWDLGRILHPQINLLENQDAEEGEEEETKDDDEKDMGETSSSILPLDTFSNDPNVKNSTFNNKNGNIVDQQDNDTMEQLLRRPTGGGSMEDDDVVSPLSPPKVHADDEKAHQEDDGVEFNEEDDEVDDDDSNKKSRKKRKEKMPLVSKSSPSRMKSPSSKETSLKEKEETSLKSPMQDSTPLSSSPSASPLHQKRSSSSSPPPPSHRSTPSPPLPQPSTRSLLRVPTDGDVPSRDELLPPVIDSHKTSTNTVGQKHQSPKTRSMKYFDDVANEDTRCCVVDSYLRGASAIGVCYDISDASTLDSLDTWLRRIGDAGVDLTKVPILLICNKIDLTDPSTKTSPGAAAAAAASGAGSSSSSSSSSNTGGDIQSSPDVSASESESEANFGDEKSTLYDKTKSNIPGGIRSSESGKVDVGCNGKRGNGHQSERRNSMSLRESIGSAFSSKSSSSNISEKKVKKMSSKKRRELERQEAATAAARRRKRLEAFPQVRLAREIGEKYGLMGFNNGHGRIELVSGTTGEGLEDALFHVAELVQKKRFQSTHRGGGMNNVLPSIPPSVSSNSLNTLHTSTTGSSNGSSSGLTNHQISEKAKTKGKFFLWSSKPKI